MNLFDFVFIAAFLFVVGSLLWIVAQWLRGRRAAAARHARVVMVFAVAYMLVVEVVAWLSPQQVLARGDTRRFDDWCISIVDATVADRIGDVSAGPDKFVVLTVRVFSAARGISQAAPHASVHLLDAADQRYDVFTAAQTAYEQLHGPQPSIGSRLPPLGSFTTTRVFRVPANLDHIDVATPHGTGPGAFIIADPANPLHPPTVFRLPLGR